MKDGGFLVVAGELRASTQAAFLLRGRQGGEKRHVYTVGTQRKADQLQL